MAPGCASSARASAPGAPVTQQASRWAEAPVNTTYDFITRADYGRLYQASVDAVSEHVAQGARTAPPPSVSSRLGHVQLTPR